MHLKFHNICSIGSVIYTTKAGVLQADTVIGGWCVCLCACERAVCAWNGVLALGRQEVGFFLRGGSP